jgi:hypothetical protein
MDKVITLILDEQKRHYLTYLPAADVQFLSGGIVPTDVPSGVTVFQGIWVPPGFVIAGGSKADAVVLGDLAGAVSHHCMNTVFCFKGVWLITMCGGGLLLL